MSLPLITDQYQPDDTRGIALALDRRARRLADGSYLTRCPAPNHGQGRGDRSPSLLLKTGDTRLLAHCFAGCAASDIIATLRQRGLLDRSRRSTVRAARTKPRTSADTSSREKAQHQIARWLWSRRQPISGSVAEVYLKDVRGIHMLPPPTLAFLPAHGDHLPALIAAFGMAEEFEPAILRAPADVRAVHLIKLKPDGSGKADIEKPKITIGSPGGLPIVLAPPNDQMALAITEGIEDALTLRESLGVGAWAAASATFMPKLAACVPDYIDTVITELHPDNGRRFALEMLDALRTRGVEIVTREASDGQA
jgi:hypothetical protein